MKKINLLLVVFVSTLSCMYAQTVRYVDNNQGAPTSALNYTTIQAAVDASDPGDIIYVQPSPNVYPDVNLDKQLHIYGIGYNPELNSGQVGYFAAVNAFLFWSGDASGTTLSGMSINTIQLNSPTYSNHNVVITNNRIRSIQGNQNTSLANNAIIQGNTFYAPLGERAIDNYNSQNWMITNNLFEQVSTYPYSDVFYRLNATAIVNNNIILNRQDGDGSQLIQVFEDCNGAQIFNNIFLFTGSNLADFTSSGNNSALNFQNNLTYSYNSTLDALGGINNIDNTDPQFTVFSQSGSVFDHTQDFNIQPGSAAENAGTDGNDLGVFNGAYPFNIRGYPNQIPYLTEFTLFNSVISAGENLDVNIKANANLNN